MYFRPRPSRLLKWPGPRPLGQLAPAADRAHHLRMISLTDIKGRCRHLAAIELLAPNARLKVADVAARL